MKQGWEIKSISDVCEVIAGQSPNGKYYNDKGDGLPFYQGKKLFGEKHLDEPNTWTSVTTKESYVGDIVMSVRAPVGDVNFNYHKKICIGRGLAGIRAGETVNKDYLFYFLIHHKNEIVGNTGAVFNSINKSQIEAIPIPIPLLEEQKRIVAKLDECFEAIDKARANVEKNLNNAKELFQSQLNQIFSQKGKGWVEKKLGEVAEVIAGQSPKGKYYNDKGVGLPFYQGKKLFGEKHLDEPNTWSSVTTKESYAGDIVMSVRAPVGDVNFNYHKKICIGRGLAGIRAGETVNKDYLFYFLIHHKNKIVGNTGAVFNSINKTQISNIIIPMVDLAQQNAIVNQLDDLKSQTQSLESNYQQELDALDELKKSILQKAFNGEL